MGRNYAGNGHFVTLTLSGSDQIVEGPDAYRCAVMVCTVPHQITLAFGTTTTVQPFVVGAGLPPGAIYRDDVGNLIERELHVVGTSGDTVCFWIGTYG